MFSTFTFFSKPSEARQLVLRRLFKATLAVTLVIGVALGSVLYLFIREAPLAPIQYNLNKARVSFIALGDQGTGNFRQWQVSRGMNNVANSKGADFVMLLGDNFYRYGIESVHDLQWRYKFENMYRGETLNQIPFYAILGNHDYCGNEQAEFQYGQQRLGSGRWHMPARDYVEYYGMDGDQALLKVIYLDTSPLTREPAVTANKLASLLEASEPAQWTIVASHVPIRTSSKHYYDEQLVSLILPVLKANKVDAYFSGHDHNQQLVHRPGEPYFVVSGTGGKHGDKLDTGFEPDLAFAATDPGFVHTSISSDTLVFEFYNSDAQLLHKTRLDRAVPLALSHR